MFRQPLPQSEKFKSKFICGGRTQEMLERAEELGRTDIANGYVEYNGKQYAIATRLTEAFYRKDVAGVGGGINNREIVLVDHDELDVIYQELRQHLEKKNQFIKDGNRDIDAITKVLKAVCEFIVNKFTGDTNEMIKPASTAEAQKYVHLGDCIKSTKGVCRHHGLLNCFLLDYLIQEKVIPLGKVRYFREKLTGKSWQGIPHLWALYLPDGYAHNDQSQVIFNVDSARHITTLIDADSILHLQTAYGEAPVQEIYNRYAPGTAVPKPVPTPPLSPADSIYPEREVKVSGSVNNVLSPDEMDERGLDAQSTDERNKPRVENKKCLGKQCVSVQPKTSYSPELFAAASANPNVATCAAANPVLNSTVFAPHPR